MLRIEDYQVHEVANALKRFLRNLEDPILMRSLADKWMSIPGWLHLHCSMSSGGKVEMISWQMLRVYFDDVLKLFSYLSPVRKISG